MFQPHRESDGFSFVYLPQKGKKPAHLLRRSLSGLGIPNSRVLDLSFPARGVIALLVHNEYYQSLLDTLDVHGVSPLKDFDPSAGSNLKDPKYDSLSPSERDSQAIEIHHHRLARIAARCPKHTRRAVGVSFVRSMGLPIELWREHNHPATTADHAAIFKADLPPSHSFADEDMSEIIDLLPSFDILLLTETWLRPGSKYPLPWSQHHSYGPLLNNNHASQGVSVLVHPSSPLSPSFLPSRSHYSVSFLLPDLLVHCLYLPPSLPDLEAIAILDSLPAAPSPSFKTIYCGDFNARCMSFGDSRTTTRGTALKTWMATHLVTCLNQELAYGIPTYEHMLANSTSSSIIDLFMSKPPMPYASMQVHSSLSLGSPHKAISLTFPSISPVLSPPSHPRRLWNLSRLREHE
ncbi:Endonuclease/exonuclease/phosphatase, partial [Blakeslea trispora]